MSNTGEKGGTESSSRDGLRLRNQDQNRDHGPEPANMSESIKRRNSSKQLLQNLIRVTVQRSQEDAEEVERERRRRAREKQKEEGILSFPEPRQQDGTQSTDFAGFEPSAAGHFVPTMHQIAPPGRCFAPTLTADPVKSEEELKPSRFVLEEDEGFSDWSHRLENRHETEEQENCRPKEHKLSAASESKHEDEEEGRGGRSSEEDSTRLSETSSSQTPVRTSYSSSVFLPQDARQHHAAGHPADRTSYLAAGTIRTRNFDQSGGAHRLDVDEEQKTWEEEEEEEEDDDREMKTMLQMQRQTSADEEIQEEEEERSSAGENRGGIHIRKPQTHRPAEEEEYHKMKNKRSEESERRRDAVSGGPAASHLNNSEGEESLNCYGPMSPTFKKLLIQFYPDEVNSRVSPDGKCSITERAESLRRSTSNVKKTSPRLSVSKIDKRLEEYTHALEISSKEGRSSCQALTDLTSPAEPVASKKNLFEAGDAWNQNIVSAAASKDADGLKVGVADLINQWVKGGEDGSRSGSPSKPAEIRPGGVLNKKNLWESLGDALSSTTDGKENSTKRYKYVVTGHGKYAKVSGNGCSEDVSCQAAEHLFEDL
ncbi:non-muscle caldesmon-like isoform X3 [Gambusia affinis]|uniref:non-muscle caldesmon-like isoform X2 n=1 Tax=Gambusia affinis TaxID=33528 RepID=UPI001CDCF992|nr:non-muscle caldesmon-like isoform X2 [Gambusia affinis]XP_043997149.1 non-muscle caldesmon-like isoform X3 [Gambusia affinis]